VAVINHHPGDTEIKRLWTESQVRGQGLGSALLDAVLAEVSGTISLTVWSWRTHARKLYESRGFTVVPPWDDRAGLVCMQRVGSAVA
jgi:ribosomal protein S18 acetylase RimI-like enzyme